MKLAIPVTPDGAVDHRWGRAHNVADVDVADDDTISSWKVHEVNWDELHDSGTHGAHHARIVRWLRENSIEAVIVNHCGQGMVNTMQKMGLLIVWDADGDAAACVNAAVPRIREALQQAAG
jgi:predicted Fe-Mo cluster-binding NifX family protein